jgi:hypothetical protein
MKIEELLTEVADRPYRYMLTKKTPTSVQYMFMTDAGTMYLVDTAREVLSDGTTRMEIAFADMSSRDTPNIDVTGKGDAFRIFATVAAVTKEAISKSKTPISELMFKGKTKDPTRIKLYDRIARSLPRFLPDFRSKGEGSDGVDKVYYFERVAEQGLAEAPLTDFEPIGDFTKPGPFRGPDKRLVPHPVNKLKAEKFFSKTPYDIRLFFSNIPGTGRYSEYGPMQHDQLVDAFGADHAQQIIKGSEDAITVVFVGNKGDAKVPLTPWIMAHRFGHAIQAGVRRDKWSSWIEAEKHFFSMVNQTLEECYGKMSSSRFGITPQSMKSDLTPEYNALFNAIGTQRSSRTNKIRRPYEFLYELFAQYLKDGEINLNPLPVSLGYGRQAWGKPTKYMQIKPEYRSDTERQDMSDRLARDMGYMFDSVMAGTVGKILVM